MKAQPGLGILTALGPQMIALDRRRPFKTQFGNSVQPVTIQRRGSTAKPFVPGGRLTMISTRPSRKQASRAGTRL